MIAILGGTGPEGFGLAVRWAMAGEAVVIGSRSADRAQEAASKVRSAVSGARVTGETNEGAAVGAGTVVVALPLDAIDSTLRPLKERVRGKLVISVVAALEWVEGRPKPVHLAAGSAAQRIAQLLPDSMVTSGFQTLSAQKLGDPSQPLDEDCIVCGDDRDARHATMDLARKIHGIRPISGGRLENSYYSEVLVGMLATLNRIHKKHAGIRLVGVGG